MSLFSNSSLGNFIDVEIVLWTKFRHLINDLFNSLLCLWNDLISHILVHIDRYPSKELLSLSVHWLLLWMAVDYFDSLLSRCRCSNIIRVNKELLLMSLDSLLDLRHHLSHSLLKLMVLSLQLAPLLIELLILGQVSQSFPQSCFCLSQILHMLLSVFSCMNVELSEVCSDLMLNHVV